MNKKQWAVVIAGTIILVLIFFITPRYKITQIDKNNYVRTEQSSSLYKRCQGKEKLHWEKIALFGGITVGACLVLLPLMGKKNG